MKVEFPTPRLTTCHHCFGRGKLKVMQSAITSDGKSSIRTLDKYTECKHCNGTGIIIIFT